MQSARAEQIRVLAVYDTCLFLPCKKEDPSCNVSSSGAKSAVYHSCSGVMGSRTEPVSSLRGCMVQYTPISC